MSNKAYLVLFIVLSTTTAHALPPQSPVNPHSVQHRKACKNLITFNFPSLFFVSVCSGVAAALQYERFVTHDGLLSATLSINVCSASTLRELHSGDVDKRVQGSYLAPGFMVHTGGNRHKADFSFGSACWIGSLAYSSNRVGSFPSGLPNANSNTTGRAAIVGVLNLTLHSNSALVFAAHFDAGSIVGDWTEGRGVVQIGIKIGGAF